MKTYIIAEAGVNHNGSLDMALQLVNVAVEAGVDAIKFQTFKADKIASHYSPKAEYQEKNTKETESQLEMLKRLELDEKAHKEIAKYCAGKGIEYLSTPFDLESLSFLVHSLQVPKLKIASGDITNAPLLLRAAQSGKDIILSTGMATLSEIEMALGVIAFGFLQRDNLPSVELFQECYFSFEGQKLLSERVKLLHCTTEYPAPFKDVNLKVMETLSSGFGLPVGYSDHTEGIAVAVAAAARGAVVIEKHFTIDRGLPGPDHAASLEPKELRLLVDSIRQVEEAIGASPKIPTPVELRNRQAARKSLVAARDIKKGDTFTEENLTLKRPGYGISPELYWSYLGRKARKDYKYDEVIGHE